MPKRIELGTDIATIGVWDPARERHDLNSAKYRDYQSSLQSEAEAGRLFFINTSADGGYLTDIYVDQTPDPDLLNVYSTVDRDFLVVSESGRFIAGGIEDFVSKTKRITSREDDFSVAPGAYALSLHELLEDKMIDRLRHHIGEEDYAYYVAKSGGIAWGCLLFVLATIFLFAKLWVVSLSLFAVWVGYLVVRSRVRAADDRFGKIAMRVEAFDELFPVFIFVLRKLSDSTAVKGGWYELDKRDNTTNASGAQ